MFQDIFDQQKPRSANRSAVRLNRQWKAGLSMRCAPGFFGNQSGAGENADWPVPT